MHVCAHVRVGMSGVCGGVCGVCMCVFVRACVHGVCVCVHVHVVCVCVCVCVVCVRVYRTQRKRRVTPTLTKAALQERI
jgi:nitrate/nitrite transporter NarK